MGAAMAHVRSSDGHNWSTNALIVSMRNDFPVPPTPLTKFAKARGYIDTCCLREVVGEGSGS